jgi:16S rRNA (adenine1518-N6/adenine1519-N6)-dimethyltransferase
MNNKPLKKFGQNYLTDRNTILKIVKKFAPNKNDNIIEIGPGRGALTNELIKFSDNVTAIEIDNRVIERLVEKFPSVSFINDDFLKIELKHFTHNQKLRIVGNIPYNITSPIIFKLIENRNIISDALLMVQYEVAKRITAVPNTKEYGILAVILNYFAETNLEFKIAPSVFSPKPKVDSAIITLKFNKLINAEFDDEHFINVVKASFGNRRKTLKNSLKNSIFSDKDFSQLKTDLTKRAENLTIDDYVILAKELQ